MKNFKQETYEAITESGHARDDVLFIGSQDGKYRTDMNGFDQLADFEYDNSYGAAEIATDLIIYFRDHTYMKRGEYDGSEWWEYNHPLTFNADDEYEPIKNFGGRGILWDTVAELQAKETASHPHPAPP